MSSIIYRAVSKRVNALVQVYTECTACGSMHNFLRQAEGGARGKATSATDRQCTNRGSADGRAHERAAQTEIGKRAVSRRKSSASERKCKCPLFPRKTVREGKTPSRKNVLTYIFLYIAQQTKILFIFPCLSLMKTLLFRQ